MKGDFTRSTFKKKNHYSSVRMQQGRVQLDADWNEQMDIQTHLSQTEATDVIGRTGCPKYGGGFKVDALPDGSDLTISPGRIYVDGILCELEEPGATYTKQPDFPNPPDVGPGDYLVYLDVWQRHITALEDEGIREKALGGPDTATRTKTIWQVKLQSPDNMDCNQIGPDWLPENVKKSGNLSARAKPGEEPDDPCILPPQAGYRRLENQLYRVEIHKSGIAGPLDDSNNATFKWSRNNGSITAKVKTINGVGEIEISHSVPGRLDEFVSGQWIELTDEDHELRGEKGVFLNILEKNGEKLTIETCPEDVGWDPNEFANNPKVRSWDSVGTLQVHIPTDNEGFIHLEGGVEIKFEDGEDYQSGDYWFIPARSATGDIEWPKHESDLTIQIFKAPDGIKHHYCQLALVNIDNNGFHFLQDCRDFFPPLNEVTIGKGCCTFTVGDGISSFGDFDSIQDAVDKVKQGGYICLLPGVHEANVTINGGRNITIKGCDKYSRIIPGKSKRDQPIFTIKNSQFITLENMDMTTFGGTAILLEAEELKEVEISGNRMFALKNAVRVVDGEKIKIIGNKIRTFDREGDEAAVFMMAQDSIIKDNDIGVVPSGELTPPDIAHNVDIPDLSNPEAEVEPIYLNPLWLIAYMNKVWENTLSEYPSEGFNAPGGIQIACTSERLKILDNRITGGYWNGITLGHTPLELDGKLKPFITGKFGIEDSYIDLNLLEELRDKFDSFIEDLVIENNEIRNMGLSGIGVINFFSLKNVGLLVSTNDVTIYRNKIVKCLQQMPTEIAQNMSEEIALGGVCLADCENLVARENLIEENGTGLSTPVCGIYIQYGEKIDISDNRVLNNGPKTLKRVAGAVSGIGGGIVIRWSLKTMLTEFIEEKKIPYTDGMPAVKIHDNIVTQPMGRALVILAMGPVSVVGNHLTSQGIDSNVKPAYWLGGAVLILNLGVSRDLFAEELLAGLKSMMQAQKNPAVYMDQIQMFTAGNIYSYDPCFLFPLQPTGDETPHVVAPIDTSAQLPVFEFLLYIPGGNVLFSNNRTTLDLRSKGRDFAICSQLIFSLDDIAYVGNQSECNSLLDAVITDVFTIGTTVRNNDNRFQEGLTITLFSLVSIGIWLITWTGNQASHCITAVGIRDEEYGNNMVLFGSLLNQIIDGLTCDMIRDWLKSFLKQSVQKALSEGTIIE